MGSMLIPNQSCRPKPVDLGQRPGADGSQDRKGRRVVATGVTRRLDLAAGLRQTREPHGPGRRDHRVRIVRKMLDVQRRLAPEPLGEFLGQHREHTGRPVPSNRRHHVGKYAEVDGVLNETRGGGGQSLYALSAPGAGEGVSPGEASDAGQRQGRGTRWHRTGTLRQCHIIGIIICMTIPRTDPWCSGSDDTRPGVEVNAAS